MFSNLKKKIIKKWTLQKRTLISSFIIFPLGTSIVNGIFMGNIQQYSIFKVKKKY